MKVLRLRPYLREMRAMGLGEPDMRAVEADILAAPEAHPVLRGVRKMRFARPGGGKSGGGRAIYYLAFQGRLLTMLTAYAKNEKDDLTPADRQAILRAIEDLLSGEKR